MRKQSVLTLAAALGLSLAGLFAVHRASARVEVDSDYSKPQTYNAALRYVRVDLGYEVMEKDPDAGYLLFRYTPPGRRDTTNGSIEVVETKERVKIVIQLPQMPSYHETVLRDGLLRKLKSEYGEPPKRKKPDEDQPRKPDGDGGPDSGDDGNENSLR